MRVRVAIEASGIDFMDAVLLLPIGLRAWLDRSSPTIR
jgi:hypothetical protein